MKQEHPTVRKFREGRLSAGQVPGTRVMDSAELKALCMQCGAEDAGFVEIGRPALDDQRDDLLRLYPFAKSLISFVCRMNREPARSPARSVANVEFHQTGDQVDKTARKIVSALQGRGLRAVNPPMAFPMEADRWPGKMWVVSHKPVAVAAGLGKMGIHRNIIHPRFGNFILLGTILIDAEVSEYGTQLDFNPCLECRLCVAACPVGAIAADGRFDMPACYHHNYREYMGGFADWVETIADSRDGKAYRAKVAPSESVSMWQSLGFGPNYKSAYCISVCPAGEDVIGPFLADKRAYFTEVVMPLQEKRETVYVVPGSDAEAYAAKRFPHKRPKRIRGSLTPTTLDAFLQGMPIAFQRKQSQGLDAVFHFTFTGEESRLATVTIKDQAIQVAEGHVGAPSLSLTADSRTWLGLLGKERSLLWALLRRKVRVKGAPRLLLAFGKCFPS